MTSPSPQQHTYPVTGSALGLPLIVLSALQFMVVLDGTVVNLALNRMQVELGLSDQLRSWVVLAYALAYGGLLLLGGRLGDAFGRKRMFLGGVGAFTAASLLCGLATGPVTLQAARVLQGVGAAVASPVAMALIVVTFAPGKTRNQAFSVFAAMTGLGSVSGLILGGALTEVSWRWIFWLNVPIGVFIVIGGLRALTVVPPQRQIKLDVTGAVLATVASTLLVFGLSMGGTGWGRPLVILPIVVGAAVLVAFFRSQRSTSTGVLPLHLFRDRRRTVVFVCLVLAGAVLMAMTVQVALFVQESLGYTPLAAGFAFIPFAVGLGLGAWVAGQAVRTIAPRFLIAAGGIFMLAGFFFAQTLNAHSGYWLHLLPTILIIATGVGLALIPLTLCVVAGVRPEDVGPLTATSLVAQTLGGPLGLAAAAAVGESRTRSLLAGAYPAVQERGALSPAIRDALAAGYTQSLLVCAGLAGIMAVMALVWVRFTPAEVAEGKKAEAAAQSG
ncbi:MFS transporter [Corynebacterium heidelbergense]|nr:MFS transporter [Corynebacterium heidelbergense]